MTPFMLTAKAVAEAALKAHEAGILTAQNGLGCYYRMSTPSGKECHCAVGAALPDDVLNDIEASGVNGQSVGDLDMRYFQFPSDEDFEEISRIQMAHDLWAQGNIDREQTFLAACRQVLAQ